MDKKSGLDKKKDTASLFLMGLLLICIATGLVRGFRIEPRNQQKKNALKQAINQ